MIGPVACYVDFYKASCVVGQVERQYCAVCRSDGHALVAIDAVVSDLEFILWRGRADADVTTGDVACAACVGLYEPCQCV